MGLTNLKILCKLIQSKKEVKEEIQWLIEVSHLMQFLDGILNKDFLVLQPSFYH